MLDVYLFTWNKKELFIQSEIDIHEVLLLLYMTIYGMLFCETRKNEDLILKQAAYQDLFKIEKWGLKGKTRRFSSARFTDLMVAQFLNTTRHFNMKYFQAKA